jgi:hypothetical protein
MWTTGFFDESGEFVAESDWASEAEAADRATFLNGGRPLFDDVMVPRPGHPVPEALEPFMS